MSEVSRRDFAVRAAALASGAWLAASARGDDDPTPGAAEADSAGPATVSEPLTFADHQLAALLEHYPAEHLTDDMRAGILAKLAGQRALAERLRRVPLPWHVEPALTFRALGRHAPEA
ncbi:MAG: hypothetical protein KF774_13540 [Planctomyces sp.]|nr:hypothetical protein [Planctomyces sp.]